MDNEINRTADNGDAEDEQLMIVDTSPSHGVTHTEEEMEVEATPYDTIPVDANDPTSDVAMVDPIDAISYRMSNLSIYWEHDYDHVHDLAVRMADLALTPDTPAPTNPPGHVTHRATSN